MTVAGIMQPYFFPYLGYFGLIRHCDRFILFDTPQYSRHGWMDRNRILKPKEGWLYIRPALEKVALGTPINDVVLDQQQNWRGKIVAQLDVYRKVAPHFRQVRAMVEEAISGDHRTLVSLNKSSLETVCAHLGMPRTLEIFSQMDLVIEQPNNPDEWALNICRALAIDEYRNPPGGMTFFDANKYQAGGVTLQFQQPRLPEYDQKRQPFEPGLSVIDALMFNTPAQVVAMLDSFDLVDAASPTGETACPPPQ